MRLDSDATVSKSLTPERQHAETQISLLKRLIISVSQAQDLNAALLCVIQTVCQQQQWLYGEAWQPDPKADTLRKHSAWYRTPVAQNHQAKADPVRFSQLSEAFTFAPGVGIPGRVWRSQCSEWHIDVSKASSAVFLRHQAAAECGIKAALGIPLIVNDHVLAVLVFFSEEAIPEDLRLVESINAISLPLGMLMQQRQAEKLLRDSEARFHAFMNHSPAMVFMKDDQGRFVYINRPLERSFNVTQAELIGKTDAYFLPEAAAREVQANDRLILSTYQAQTVIEKVPTPDGVVHYWQVIKFPFTDHAGQRFVGGVAFDVTPQKRFEQQLAEEKELAQVTLKSIGDAVITTDAAGKIQYLNPVAEALTGWSQEEAQAKPLSEVFQIVHETTRQPVANPVIEVLQERQVVGLANHTALIARDGTERAIEDSAAPIQTQDGQLIGAVMVFHDVSQTRQLTKQLSWQASHDMLTGLVNRREFERRLTQAVDNAHSHQKVHALCYLDLDNFKVVNDTCGHATGDRLLQQLSQLLTEQLRIADILARLGGDEFALLLEYCPLDQAIRIANELREKLKAFRFNADGKVFSVGVSIGVATITAESDSAATALSDADAACYIAKRKGRNRVHVHQPDDLDLAQQRGETQWAAYIAEALETDRFCLYYQSILPLRPDCLAAESCADYWAEHYEVLLRLRDQTDRLISPDTFIPAAERYNLMPQIDRWVVKTLFATQSAHYQQVWARSKTQPCVGNALYSINLSGASINDDEFIDFLHEQLALHQIPPAVICFEITETAAISNLTKAAQFIGELRQLGCQFALDDFGSGMSSFAYLRTLPIDYLKIDGRFIRNIVNDDIDTAMVTAIHQIAQVMDIRTIAEFVENEAILKKIRGLGIDYAQGYGITRPEPLLT